MQVRSFAYVIYNNSRFEAKTIKKIKNLFLELKIKSRYIRKRFRDHVQPTIVTYKRNRKFKRNVIFNKKKEKHKCYRVRMKESIQQVKQNAPDQNAINFSSAVLSVKKMSLLVRRPSFVTTLSDINW